MTHLNWKPLAAKTPQGTEVVLRRLEMEDIAHCGQWINDPENRQLLQVDYPLGKNDELKWLESVTAPLPSNPAQIALAIWVDNVMVGTCSLKDISQRHRHAEIGIVIGDKTVRGKGIGVTTYQLLHYFAFEELNLEALKADVYSHNKASQKLHQKMGYIEFGRIPNWYFKAGKYRDLIIYHLSRDSWQK